MKAELCRGQRKSLQTDRVVLVPGPEREVRIVNLIYNWFIDESMNEFDIAARLNSMNVRTDSDRDWTRATVREVLTNEKYIGNNIYNRVSYKLKRARVVNAPDMWIRKDSGLLTAPRHRPGTFAPSACQAYADAWHKHGGFCRDPGEEKPLSPLPHYRRCPMPAVNLPLSGAVNQTINPWLTFLPLLGSQVGSYTVNVGNSSDPEIEQAVLDVASYGKQLGRISDVLIVLLEHFQPKQPLSQQDQDAIDALKRMLARIAKVKEQRGSEHVLRPR
ncbi:hypothetical protein ACEQUB_03546 [Ralstonia syzygii]|uniref:Putative recombinase n=1 Tax=Ralstonia syzygii R24 TaxID=907261 RepID=G3A2X7_9RALS|nr:putative recombinase [Ralstonia syzygii R24]